MRVKVLCLVVLLLTLATGCVYSRGVIGFVKAGPAEASASRHTVVQPGLRGDASCAYLFGVLPMGNTAVATRAMDELREAARVASPDRSIGLVNFTGDETIANYFGIVTSRSLSITADSVDVTR